MFWKLSRSPIIIPAELHEKLARTSKPIEQVDSEVIGVRRVRQDRSSLMEAADRGRNANQNQQGTDKSDLTDAIGYDTHWQWYR